ncbi:hypothetical protein N7481_010769 [Penicillium waksmanii]|uniref:uncharacterized protein n=1 Tax=Penicillium waksmanii TaxID=69791 RepID=UPI002546AF43|nr:uncharacterized protein N7481_010769 [Penicillium waksmanii]KAJ5973559.1 hypothetical protein N7481_010769 [Penicillium waksmanii]
MADNATPGSAAGNVTSSNNDSAAGNAPEREDNPQPLTADMLDKAADRLDILVAKHFQEDAGKLPDDAHDQAAPDVPYLGLRDRDDNGDFKIRDKLSALDEYLATIHSIKGGTTIPARAPEAIATNAMIENMMKEDPSLTSNFESGYLRQITETKNRVQAAVAWQNKKMEEDQSEAMED